MLSSSSLLLFYYVMLGTFFSCFIFSFSCIFAFVWCSKYFLFVYRISFGYLHHRCFGSYSSFYCAFLLHIWSVYLILGKKKSKSNRLFLVSGCSLTPLAFTEKCRYQIKEDSSNSKINDFAVAEEQLRKDTYTENLFYFT